jgi:hypothetical protein
MFLHFYPLPGENCSPKKLYNQGKSNLAKGLCIVNSLIPKLNSLCNKLMCMIFFNAQICLAKQAPTTSAY